MKTTLALFLAPAVLCADPQTSTFTFNDPAKNTTVETTSYVDPESKNKIHEMRQTWRDYFLYAFEAKNVTDSVQVAECSTETECDNSGKLSQCCVSAVLHHKASGTQDIMYRCMTKAVAQTNLNMQIADFEVNMKCVGSGAQLLAVGASALLVAQTLF